MPRARDGRPSTDGTMLGADIAEVMGTDDEQEIQRRAQKEQEALVQSHLTGVDEEQADWEADEESSPES